MFGSTPVVSVRHSSSDEEADEPARSGVNVRATGFSHQPVMPAPRQVETKPITNAQENVNNQFTKPNNNPNLAAEKTSDSKEKEAPAPIQV